jgi:hypothetical protein
MPHQTAFKKNKTLFLTYIIWTNNLSPITKKAEEKISIHQIT